jgi:predicted N-formylglutamate amidohydrolase
MVALFSACEAPAFCAVRPNGASQFLLACDHASNAFPIALGDLGLNAVERSTHIAWDIGAAEVARRLSELLDACCILHNYSRLVIDANRPPGSPQSIVTLSERTCIPGNEGLSQDEVSAREQAVFWPYHERIRAELDRRASAGRPTLLVSVHSFTPVFHEFVRPWHCGLLYQRDVRLARALLPRLRSESQLVVGDNEPYAMRDGGDYTLVEHGEQRGVAHVGIEIRQDLIAHAAGQAEWAERLAARLTEAARDMLRAEAQPVSQITG